MGLDAAIYHYAAGGAKSAQTDQRLWTNPACGSPT
jgi:hypothetical protein